ncbi:unnamed protein product [Paramecium sonneborni]|uniref:Uncharacterized protein n=1 Tax=Paramecium sonneborni TaxID=65129 RepID=A0A8S1QPC1_9CILI|nr:unnamed protein product [Paramecium sonneborni]
MNLEDTLMNDCLKIIQEDFLHSALKYLYILMKNSVNLTSIFYSKLIIRIRYIKSRKRKINIRITLQQEILIQNKIQNFSFIKSEFQSVQKNNLFQSILNLLLSYYLDGRNKTIRSLESSELRLKLLQIYPIQNKESLKLVIYSDNKTLKLISMR